jgi:hypothetical protein
MLVKKNLKTDIKNNGNKKYTQLLIIIPYIFTNEDVCKIKNINNKNRTVKNILPKYALNEKFNSIVNSDFYFQFYNEGLINSMNEGEKKETHYLFDVHYIDPILEFELENVSLEDTLKDFYTELLNIIQDTHNNVDHYGYALPPKLQLKRLTLDVKYEYSFGYEDIYPDVEVIIENLKELKI